MILAAARMSLSNLFAPETRSVFWKVIGLTLVCLVAVWFALRGLFYAYVLPWIASVWPAAGAEWAGWVTFFVGILASIGLALGLALLLAPINALIAGLFLDDVADVIEKRDYPALPPGRPMPIGAAIVEGAKFLGVVIAGNIIALFLLLVPGVNLIAFFVVNGYLLGREFFEFAAMRHLSPDAARELRARHAGRVTLAGFLIAGFLAIPVVNLLTPLFAAGLMVHLYKAIAANAPATLRPAA
ncbi:sulfate transporter family protein [Rhizobium sp. SG2393]|uniref:sulfate transporter family protein n=1 Tax=Rhizobium sp. SG2393 TaxID=3276279 RepID=UPI00366EA701